MHTLRRTLAGTAVLSMLAGLPLSALGSPTEADQAPFGRVSTYPVYLNVPAGTDRNAQTNAEISTVSQDGNTLIYTDAAESGLVSWIFLILPLQEDSAHLILLRRAMRTINPPR